LLLLVLNELIYHLRLLVTVHNDNVAAVVDNVAVVVNVAVDNWTTMLP
jgi:hypothetical protein